MTHRGPLAGGPPTAGPTGHVAALVYNDKQWAAFVGAVSPAWADESFATLDQRAAKIDEVYALLAGTFLERTTAQWLELLRSLDIPAAPVRGLDELERE